MEACIAPINNKEYTAPTQDYERWSQEKLLNLYRLINKQLQNIDKPAIIVLEIAHFTLPLEEENKIWAERNMKFANELCGTIIKEHQHKFKIIPTLLLNNLDEEGGESSKNFINSMVKGQKYIREESVRMISERNLKNRAFKALKKNQNLADSFINIDGKAYLKDDDYQHDLAAGFINDDGKIIPRCGLILTSFLDMVAKLANDRLHQKEGANILFISFSEQFHEYQRVRLGVDIYSQTHKNATIHPIVIHWSYEIDQSLTSYRECNTQAWQEEEL
jgi:hypothetical protein